MTRQVTLVCGPPCAGKSFYVAARAKPGDTVLDVDVLAKLNGSPRDHGHDGRYYRAAQVEYDQLCDLVRTSNVSAWVIRGAPEPAKRRALADRVNATRTVVLLPPRDVLHQRALDRDQDSAAVDTMKAITNWYRRYKPDSRDVLITYVPLEGP